MKYFLIFCVVLLTSCSALDQLLIQNPNLDNELKDVGSGLSGLTGGLSLAITAILGIGIKVYKDLRGVSAVIKEIDENPSVPPVANQLNTTRSKKIAEKVLKTTVSQGTSR